MHNHNSQLLHLQMFALKFKLTDSIHCKCPVLCKLPASRLSLHVLRTLQAHNFASYNALGTNSLCSAHRASHHLKASISIDCELITIKMKPECQWRPLAEPSCKHRAQQEMAFAFNMSSSAMHSLLLGQNPTCLISSRQTAV